MQGESNIKHRVVFKRISVSSSAYKTQRHAHTKTGAHLTPTHTQSCPNTQFKQNRSSATKTNPYAAGYLKTHNTHTHTSIGINVKSAFSIFYSEVYFYPFVLMFAACAEMSPPPQPTPNFPSPSPTGIKGHIKSSTRF
jgi:hypothetical protein